jgi:hypothetical protein
MGTQCTGPAKYGSGSPTNLGFLYCGRDQVAGRWKKDPKTPKSVKVVKRLGTHNPSLRVSWGERSEGESSQINLFVKSSHFLWVKI